MTPAEYAARNDRRARLAIAAIIVIGVLLRLLVLRSPGFPSDVGTFQAWAERLAQIGPGRFYAPGYFSDYPPGYLYVLWLFGALFDGELLRLAVKAASIPADVGLAILSASLVWRASRAAAIVAAGLWMLAPGPIFAGPYWGQVDAVGTVPLMAALVFAGRGRWATAGTLAGVALMVKPQFGIALAIVLAAAIFAWIRDADWRPAARAFAASAATIVLLGLPFRSGPAELIALVRSAAETYPYTSLYAFNIWSIVGDFWQPDVPYVAAGAALLIAGVLGATALTWWRRDVPTMLAAGAVAAFAFYFLPTRAHERYLFPAFALLLPIAAVRGRLFVPYVALALAFAMSLFFAFTRYGQNDLRSPAWLEETLFTRNGQIFIALVMIGSAGFITWRLIRGDAALVPEGGVARTSRNDVVEGRTGLAEYTAATRLSRILAFGGRPTRRDIAVAFLVALVVLVTRGFRLDQPRDMYFDEVYHARTAFELLAQREPYEWTHPHLAKEIMALGILAFGGDRIVGTEAGRGGTVAFAVSNDGRRAYASADGAIFVQDRDGRGGPLTRALAPPRALAFDGDRLYVLTDMEVCAVAVPATSELGANAPPRAFAGCAALPQRSTAFGLSVSAGRVAALTQAGLYLYPSLETAPIVKSSGAAMTSRPDGTAIYVLDPAGGVVRALDSTTGDETKTYTVRGPGTAIAYAQSANRIFLARSDTPALDVIDLEGGATDTVPLSNATTGEPKSASALAVVPRTQFLYALAGTQVIVIETHGASAFAAIPVRSPALFLGLDGDDDKLLVAGPDTVERIETGRHGLAWRIPGVLFAALLAFFLVLLARRLFASPRIAYFVGAAVILDGSMFAQARIGMNDIYVTALIVAGWYFVVAAHAPRRRAAIDILIAGALFGLALSAKWAGAYTLAGVLIASLVATAYAYERGRPGTGGPLDLFARRGRNAALLFGAFAALPALIYLASYRSWFGGPMAPYGWNLWELTQQMYWYHSSLTSPHCAGAPWWSWPLDLKPTYWYFGAGAGGLNGYIYDAGNPILFWVALPAAAIVGGLAVRARSAPLGLVTLAMLAQFVAWIPISRVLFFYHFFTVLPFYLLCLAIVLALLWERRRRAVIVLAAVAAAAFVLFYPFVSGMPIPGDAAGVYFILPTWQYDPAFFPTDSCPTPVGSSVATGITVAVAWILELAALALGVGVAIGFAPVRRLLLRVGIET
ncbi:MAG TPA: phospholipid carrier-dependent glycosyltransferase [Candidatus Limnocylindrales bacterium]|nr:phospholipid carrier-dependent glycosyltransferase [Candidatus Limnocylindrales bacterium]